MKKKQPVLAVSLIVLATVIFDVALHQLCGWAFHFNYFDNGLPPSALVKGGVFPAAASLGFGIGFGFLSLSFLRSRAELGGKPLQASQRFFAPLALVMFFGVLESAFVFPTPFRSELITAIADAVPFVFLGALLSVFAGPEVGDSQGREGGRAPWQSMLWVALFYVAGRYLLSYPVLQIKSGYLERPVGTFAWTLGCGLGMGAFYWLAGSYVSASTPWRRALRVGGFTLGLFWLWVQLFYALIFAVSVSDLVIRGTADTSYLVLGIYSFERLFRKGRSMHQGRPEIERP